MHFGISCTAPSELLRRTIPIYIHFNDDAAVKG